MQGSIGALATRLRFVLVGTQHSGNIGAAARAIKTMGFRRLVLVAPSQFPSAEASWMAVHAEDVLASAHVVDSLAEAVADCGVVIGTSVRPRRLSLPILDARAAAEWLLTTPANTEIAVLFGRESSGLAEDELALCNRQLRIASDAGYASLNLAMAVQIVAYELRLAAAAIDVDRQSTARQPIAAGDDPLATPAELGELLRRAEASMTAVGYHDPARPRLLLPRLRRLFARAGLLASEVRLLHGALSAIDSAVRALPPGPDETAGRDADPGGGAAE